jgi:hypothetical protein
VEDVNKKGRKSCTPKTESDPERGERAQVPAAAGRSVPGDACMLLCPAPHRPGWPTVSGPAAWWRTGRAAWVETRPAGGSGEPERPADREDGRKTASSRRPPAPRCRGPRWPLRLGSLGPARPPPPARIPRACAAVGRLGGLQFTSSLWPGGRGPICDALY